MRVAALLLVASCAWPSFASARPTDVIHPGGVPAVEDTLVFDYPVLQSPSLLSLRAPSLLETGMASAPDTAASPVPLPTPRTVAAASTGGTGFQASLLFSGSKSLSVEMGRGRDASLHQTLDLTVRGRVAGDVELAATLSDQELPFEPDGTTRELQDLDRLFLSIRAPQGEVTMGDFRLDVGPGEFARVARQLQGVRGQAKVAGSTWDVAAASAKGQRGTIETKGEEGKQGPYELVARVAGDLPPGVVAGSETVWLDGAKLKRGADQDYVIDYGAGTVTFTTRHPITAESRIAFDFEQASTNFRRSLYAAFTQGPIASSGRWYATYLRDGDDPKSPIDASLTPENLRELGSLGDSAATSSGARYVGAGNGEYDWDESDLANPHWVHLGAGRGQYLVEFVSVGTGRGAYADTLGGDGARFYNYMGRNLGSFVPGRSLPSPAEQQLLDLGGSAKLFGALSLEAEGARSGLDKNALSSLDDADNGGGAMRLGAQLDPRALSVAGHGLGALRASAAFRSRDSRFTTMDRLDNVFEGDRWNQAAGLGGETRGEVALQYEPVAALSIRGEAGKRNLDGGSRSVRRALAADWRGPLVGSVRWEGSRNSLGAASGSRERLGFDLARQRGFVAPRMHFLDERIRGQEGDTIPERRSREWSMGLGVTPATRVNLRASYGERVDRRGDPSVELVPTRAATWEAGLSARARSSLSVEMGWTRRRVADPNGMTASDLAQLAFLAGAPGGAFTSELRYDATQLREPQIIRRVVAVNPGAGSYDAFGNPRYQGDYQVVTETGLPAARTRANVQIRLDAYPGRAVASGKAPTFWRAWGMSTFLRLETLSSLALGDPSHAFDPRSYLDPAATIRGNVNARQTVEYAPAGGKFDVRLEGGARRDRTGELENLRVVRDGRDGTLRVRNPIGAGFRLITSATMDGTKETAQRTDSGERYASRLRGQGLDLELQRSLGPTWSVSLIGRGRRDRDVTLGGTRETVAGGPSARCASGGKLRVDGRALWARTSQLGSYQPGLGFTPPLLGNHIDYDFLGDYRLRDQISVGFSWNGQVASGRGGVYNGRFELKSYF
ncbi:MAG TPA: hypothetical protein VN539_03660 [Candidatus Saccharimonadales bacterium]|nr:hypothetical protein [Candidatus Saccharimonadales bacterium]